MKNSFVHFKDVVLEVDAGNSWSLVAMGRDNLSQIKESHGIRYLTSLSNTVYLFFVRLFISAYLKNRRFERT